MKTQKISKFLILCGLCISVLQANAQEKTAASVETPHPVLAELAVRLRPMILKIQPEAIISFERNQLVAQYQTQKFIVHPVGKNGIIDEQVHEEIGPNVEGFLLELSIRKANSAPQAAILPQELHRPYWTTYLNRYVLMSQNQQDVQRAASVPRTDEIVSRERDSWVYDAFYYLAQQFRYEGYPSNGGEDRLLTRYEAAIATARLMNRWYPLIEGGVGGEIVSAGKSPRLPRALTFQEYSDLLSALTREFAPELVALDVRREALEIGLEDQDRRTDTYIWMSLSYGQRVDTKLIEQIKQTVAAFAAEKAAQEKAAQEKANEARKRD